MRALATIETIADVRAIPDADAIESAVVRGWNVVTKRGEFRSGDRCLYVEIDAALPMADERFAFLAARGTKTTVSGVLVHVIKTARLRGVYSQGLALPLDAFPELADTAVGENVSARLGIERWEPPLPAALSAEMVGAFPTHLARKTDAERVQNLIDVYERLRTSYEWLATEKVDGTSATFIKDGADLRVCGRNFEYRRGSDVYWETADRLDLAARLADREVVQGEIFGEGVQANPLKVRGRRLAAFGFFRERRSVPWADWPTWLREHAAPIVDVPLPERVDLLLATVDGFRSVVSPAQIAEGVVFHTLDGRSVPELDGRACFKAISNKYLLKHGG